MIALLNLAMMTISRRVFATEVYKLRETKRTKRGERKATPPATFNLTPLHQSLNCHE